MSTDGQSFGRYARMILFQQNKICQCFQLQKMLHFPGIASNVNPKPINHAISCHNLLIIQSYLFNFTSCFEKITVITHRPSQCEAIGGPEQCEAELCTRSDKN